MGMREGEVQGKRREVREGREEKGGKRGEGREGREE